MNNNIDKQDIDNLIDQLCVTCIDGTDKYEKFDFIGTKAWVDSMKKILPDAKYKIIPDKFTINPEDFPSNKNMGLIIPIDKDKPIQFVVEKEL